MTAADRATLPDGAWFEDPFAVFTATVTLRQVSQWLPERPSTILDVSRPLPDSDPFSWDGRIGEVLAAGGHRSFGVGRTPGLPAGRGLGRPSVIADIRSLDWVRPSSVDAVIAEGGALSDCLAAESTVVLR